MKKTFEINCLYDNNKQYSARVLEERELVNGVELVSPYKIITIQFDYPLSTIVNLTFESTDPQGFTRHTFWKAIKEGYKLIYQQEHEDASKNQKGRHGIWGHYIDDLFIEGVEEVEESKYKLIMGS